MIDKYIFLAILLFSATAIVVKGKPKGKLKKIGLACLFAGVIFAISLNPSINPKPYRFREECSLLLTIFLSASVICFVAKYVLDKIKP